MEEHPTLAFSGRIRSFGCAFNGVRIMIRSQRNAWIHAFATVAVLFSGLAFGITIEEWCWIVLAVTLVWAAEAINTAIEFLTDVVSPAYHPIAGKAKDVAAGAVLLTALGSVVIGTLVFGPYLFG